MLPVSTTLSFTHWVKINLVKLVCFLIKIVFFIEFLIN
jgi:hypothetical protein